MTRNIENDVCLIDEKHDDAVNQVLKRIESSETLKDLSNLFKIFGDHTRIRILHALSFSELCVCDLVSILKMSQSAISHQLRILRAEKVVRYRKEGKNVFYRLEDEHIFTLLNTGMEHIKE